VAANAFAVVGKRPCVSYLTHCLARFEANMERRGICAGGYMQEILNIALVLAVAGFFVAIVMALSLVLP
jgi:hypothetical protein